MPLKAAVKRSLEEQISSRPVTGEIDIQEGRKVKIAILAFGVDFI
jgi:hypothetical protein